MEQSDNRTQAILYWQRREANGGQAEQIIQVLQDDCYRSLLLNNQRQGQMQLQNSTAVTYPHLQLFMQLLEPLPWRHLLQLGLGAGELSRAVASRWPERQLSTVEQNADIIRVYQQFFQPATTEQLFCDTAQQFCQHALQRTRCYEVIFVDLYPWPADWELLLHQLLQLLPSDGVLYVNLPVAELLPALQAFARTATYQLQSYHIAGYQNKILQLKVQ